MISAKFKKFITINEIDLQLLGAVIAGGMLGAFAAKMIGPYLLKFLELAK